MKEETKESVLEGYRRLAFGEIKDAVRLLFCESATPQMLRNLDLFCVSEIRSVKGGGMEIKFYDRIRALECMRELADAEGDRGGFYRALEEGAKALSNEPAALSGETP